MKNDLDNNIANQSYREEFIDLKEIFKVIWNGRLIIFIVFTFFSLTAVYYSLNLPNIYQSNALLSPVSNKNDNSNITGNYSSLANLAGININSSNGSNKAKAIEKLNTLSFFSDSILPNIFLPNLMAVDYWDATSNTLIYNDNIFNNKAQKWVREFEYPYTQIPSKQESFNIFKNHLSISEDKDTNFINISVKHQSPYIAQEWTEMIVREINKFFRVKDKIEAQASMDFLNMQMSKTTFSEIKQVIAQLLQQKTQKLTLIEVNDFYVFEYIDPPVVMEKKIGPKRSIICIFGALLGVILGTLIVLIRHFVREN
jgi:LPS O-antigen subunit length determinant protein (WzzB/FepE family)